MNLTRYPLLLVLASLLGPAALWAEDEPPSPAELSRWANELGSSSYQVRQNASQQLVAAGPAATQTLVTVAQTGDSEVRRRAVQALLQQGLDGQHARRTPARQALESLTACDDKQVIQAAQAALDTIRDVTVSLAAAELTRLGASVMPQSNSDPPYFAVQVRQSWMGGDDGLALLSDLGRVTWLSLENAPVTDRCLVHVAGLSGLQNLYLGGTKITGSGLGQLAPLTELRYLSLKQLPLDDDALAKLPDLPRLQLLGLDYTNLGDAGLSQVARYPSLQTLWLDYTRITDAGLARLRPLTSLRTLYMSGTKVTGPGLADLRHLPDLRYLSLKDTRIAADSLKYAGQIGQLETLGLDNTNVTDEQLADLGSLSQLRVLWLSNAPITDDGVRQLKGLKNLQIVYLNGTKASAEVVAEMKRVLPRLQISTDP